MRANCLYTEVGVHVIPNLQMPTAAIKTSLNVRWCIKEVDTYTESTSAYTRLHDSMEYLQMPSLRAAARCLTLMPSTISPMRLIRASDTFRTLFR